MKTNQVVQTTALSKVNGNSSLREGSSVFVRVLKNNGKNSYIVAFSGGRFAIKSEVALKEGAGFFAKIKLADGKIVLQKINPSASEKTGLQKLDQAQQKSFFQNLGLIPDNISYTLFQQMKQLGVRLEQRLFNKARSVSKDFKGSEIEAAETAFILEEKGISAGKDSVKAVMGGKGDFIFLVEPGNTEEPDCNSNPFEEFFKRILCSETELKNSAGVLTVFNHLGFSFEKPETSGSWIKIPFVFSTEDHEGSGSFCAFLSNFSKNMESANIDFNIDEVKYYFSFSLKDGKLSYLRTGCSDSSKIDSVVGLLEKRFENVPLEIMEDANSCFNVREAPIESFLGEA